jgi:peptidoglycan hydrolase-like protein with peptidoglycan-binding domain
MPNSVRRDNQFDSKTLPSLLHGATGSDVIRLQTLLQNHGFNPGPADGKFGSRTHVALYRFQFSRNLGLTGSVDLDTWHFLAAS